MALAEKTAARAPSSFIYGKDITENYTIWQVGERKIKLSSKAQRIPVGGGPITDLDFSTLNQSISDYSLADAVECMHSSEKFVLQLKAAGSPFINIVLDDPQLIIHIDYSSCTLPKADDRLCMHELYDIQVPVELTPQKMSASFDAKGILNFEKHPLRDCLLLLFLFSIFQLMDKLFITYDLFSIRLLNVF